MCARKTRCGLFALGICVSTNYLGNPSRGTALRTIVAATDLLQAKACAIISPESSAIEAEWIDRLLTPVCRRDFDFVTPVYRST